MKKILTVFLSLFLAIFLISGCGGEENSSCNVESQNTAQASPVAKVIPNFTAKTIAGETVTNEIFASKKITVVNIWGTFCPPCIAEMPELGEMARALPAEAQIIGLVCDTSEDSTENIPAAQKITAEANADFINIVPDAELLKFIDNVEAVPTTIFINSKGEVVGKAIIGADVAGYKDELEKLLKE